MLCGDQVHDCLHAMWIARSTGFKTSIKRLPGTYAENWPMVHPTILGALSECPFCVCKACRDRGGDSSYDRLHNGAIAWPDAPVFRLDQSDCLPSRHDVC